MDFALPIMVHPPFVLVFRVSVHGSGANAVNNPCYRFRRPAEQLQRPDHPFIINIYTIIYILIYGDIILLFLFGYRYLFFSLYSYLFEMTHACRANDTSLLPKCHTLTDKTPVVCNENACGFGNYP